MDEQLTVSTMGEYPATRPLEVEKKQTSTTTTSATGEPAPVRCDRKRVVAAEDFGVI
jgi:hypothetical protein